MTLKPCIDCGTPTNRPRCDEHRARDTRRHRGHGHAADDPQWRRLSKRLRRLSPFCEICGTTEQLGVDHIIPKSEAPALIYNVANLRVLCRTCNSTRGTNVTDTERNLVHQRLADQQHRRQTRGVGVNPTHSHSVGKAEFPSQLGTVVSKGAG